MGKEIDWLKYPESKAIIDYIERRHKKGYYTQTLVTGLPGTGKSSACQRLGELVSERIHGKNTINPDDIVDSFLKFLARLMKVKRPGEIIIIEEVSVLFPSRRAMASDNVEVGKILDTCRKRQVILFSNAPVFSTVDSHIRMMSHILIQTERIIKSKEICIFRAWILQTNPHTGKTYKHTFQSDGYDVNFFYVGRPDTSTWDAYEEDKDLFIEKLFTKSLAKIRKKEEKENKTLGLVDTTNPLKLLTPKQYEVFLLKEQGLNQKEIAEKLKVAPSNISQISKNIHERLNYYKGSKRNQLLTPNLEPTS